MGIDMFQWEQHFFPRVKGGISVLSIYALCQKKSKKYNNKVGAFSRLKWRVSAPSIL